MGVWFSHTGSPLAYTERVERDTLSNLYAYEGEMSTSGATMFQLAYKSANVHTIRAFNVGYMNPRTRVSLSKT